MANCFNEDLFDKYMRLIPRAGAERLQLLVSEYTLLVVKTSNSSPFAKFVFQQIFVSFDSNL